MDLARIYDVDETMILRMDPARIYDVDEMMTLRMDLATICACAKGRLRLASGVKMSDVKMVGISPWRLVDNAGWKKMLEATYCYRRRVRGFSRMCPMRKKHVVES
jgi:hypothetical protein